VPSVGYETFGLVVIEAFRHGTPVLARRVGSLPELVYRCGGGETFATPGELAAAMRRVQDDPRHRAALARAAYTGFVEHWSESAVVPRYLELVARVARRKGHARVVDALGAGAHGVRGAA
jgi:glycosyltransferase involved in cell wall biosynthesis